ncbi:hypothetical protein B0H17DRAFT_1198403 [Mycena rosella]|uniref:F-box domain-containing protein n=1 Tax=Mycena rosella TaxID=1033263 RepID=A0AAD7DNP6_MYCRO|nr:hypothetical protein B0H17DRAFT_1198403 [Mycena rosella]
MTEGNGLQNLVEDVLILILTHCDVLSVVAIGATSKYFHHLALTRNVWLAFVTQLVQRRFIDRRPDDENLRDLSTEQLVDKVKIIFRGPKTWSPETHPHPIESRRIVLHPDIPPGISFWKNEPKLLPGGKYVLFQNQGTLECWNVFEDELIWQHACSMNHATVLSFAAELTEDDQLIILTCQHTWNYPRKNFFEFTTLDLRTVFPSLILVGRFADSPLNDAPYTCCALCGDIAAVELNGQVTLVNWRTSSCVVILTRSPRYHSHIALATNCLVLTLLGPHGEPQLACSPLPSPASWAPIDSVREPSSSIPVEALPITFGDTISVNGRTFTHRVSRSFLSVHESPINPGRFRVWLHIANHEMGALCSYEFVFRESEVSWRRRSSVLVNPKIRFFNPAGVAFSGHVLGSPTVVFPPVPLLDELTAPRVSLTLENRGDFTHLSPYSGAVTYATNKSLAVVYYN